MICENGNNNFLIETLRVLRENEVSEDDISYVELVGKNIKTKKHVPYDNNSNGTVQESISKLYTKEDGIALYHISWEDFKDAIKNINYNENYMFPPVFDTRMRIVTKNGSFFKRIAYRYTSGTLNEFWRYVKIREIGELEKYSSDIMYIEYPHKDPNKNEYRDSMQLMITNLE